MARVDGDRRVLAALGELVRAQLSLRELDGTGVRFDAQLALTVASLMIDPAQTAGEQFTIAHQAPDSRAASGYLHVHDRRRPWVTAAAGVDAAAATVVCPAHSLMLTLAGVEREDAYVRGERRPLELLAAWLAAAQGI
jgi:hypothetical protein